MRIIENSPSRVRLRDRTLWISGVSFAAAAFIAVRFALKHPPLSALAPVPFFLLFGLAFLGAADVTFDRTTGRCRIWRLSALGASTREIAFGDITDIRVDTRMSAGSGAALMCRLTVVLADGPLPLTTSYEQSFDRYEAMRGELCRVVFSGRPQAPPASDPVGDLVRAGRRVDAIALLRTREKLGLTEATERVDAVAKTSAG